jgi:hypothetical protein
MSTFSDEQLRSRAFLRVARILYEQWEEFGGGDTRLFEWLIDDSLTPGGTSKKGSDWREHVVPRAVIRDVCLDIFRSGGSIEQAAAVIGRCLKVTRIAKEEAELLDFKLGLRSSMPPGWDYRTGNPFARVAAAGIELIEEPGSPK